MRIAYVLYPDFTGLDLVGPYEVISRWPDAEVHFVARTLDPVRADRGLTVIPTDTPETLPNPDLIVVPGSENPLPVMDDQVLVEWLRTAAPGCQWTASVCTGAGLYAAAGLLNGRTGGNCLCASPGLMIRRSPVCKRADVLGAIRPVARDRRRARAVGAARACWTRDRRWGARPPGGHDGSRSGHQVESKVPGRCTGGISRTVGREKA